MVCVDSRVSLKIKAATYSLGVGTQPFYELQPAVRLASAVHPVGVELHRVVIGSAAYVSEGELPLKVVQEFILQDKHEPMAQCLKGAYFVVQLDQGRLRGHLPVHAVASTTPAVFAVLAYSCLSQEPLTSRPDRSRRIECLQLNTDEVPHGVPIHRNQEVVHATARQSDFRYDV